MFYCLPLIYYLSLPFGVFLVRPCVMMSVKTNRKNTNPKKTTKQQQQLLSATTEPLNGTFDLKTPRIWITQRGEKLLCSGSYGEGHHSAMQTNNKQTNNKQTNKETNHKQRNKQQTTNKQQFNKQSPQQQLNENNDNNDNTDNSDSKQIITV